MWLDEVADDAIDSTSRVPLHVQLSSVLRARVVEGSLPGGTRFPTEADLQARFGISRSVVRQSLLALTAEGLIERGRGRGSVVAPRDEHHRLVQRISGLSTQLAEVTTAVERLGPDDDAHAAEILGTSKVTIVRRVRAAEREPIAVIETWLREDVGSGLTPEELTDTSLHAVLQSKYGISVVAGSRQVRAVAASAVLAHQLGIEPGAPLLLLEGTSVDEAGTPVEVFRTWHRGDRVVFDLDVIAGSDARTAAFDGGTARIAPNVGALGSDAAREVDASRSRATPEIGASPSGTALVALTSRMRDLARELSDLSEQLGRS